MDEENSHSPIRRRRHPRFSSSLEQRWDGVEGLVLLLLLRTVMGQLWQAHHGPSLQVIAVVGIRC